MENEVIEHKSNRGGKRRGSGRPKTGRLKIYVSTSISGSPEEINYIKEKAKESGKTLSRYVIDLIYSI